MSTEQILEAISELSEDNTVPKNIKIKLNEIVKILKEDSENSIKINKAQHILEEIGDDINMESYTRTQIWNLTSMFEML